MHLLELLRSTPPPHPKTTTPSVIVKRMVPTWTLRISRPGYNLPKEAWVKHNNALCFQTYTPAQAALSCTLFTTTRTLPTHLSCTHTHTQLSPSLSVWWCGSTIGSSTAGLGRPPLQHVLPQPRPCRASVPTSPHRPQEDSGHHLRGHRAVRLRGYRGAHGQGWLQHVRHHPLIVQAGQSSRLPFPAGDRRERGSTAIAEGTPRREGRGLRLGMPSTVDFWVVHSDWARGEGSWEGTSSRDRR